MGNQIDTDRRLGHSESLDLDILRITLRWLIDSEVRFGKGHKEIERHTRYATSIAEAWVDQVAGDDHRYYKKALDCIDLGDLTGALKWIDKIEEV